jgi:hypothetical protein
MMLFGMMHRTSGKKDYENIEPVKKQETTTQQPSQEETKNQVKPVRPPSDMDSRGGMYHSSSGRSGFEKKK